MANRVLAGRYELIEKIGEGGMAVVFKSKDTLLDRFVAVKILRPEYLKDEVFIESFRRESQLIAGIVDNNIVNVYDVGQQGNIYYIVMELVEGETLSEVIKREVKLPAKTVASYGRQIAMALCTAHKNHLIHRDIKPHNIMVTNDGVAKLTDFGIAKRVTNDTLVGAEKEAVMGSIHYFAPEQARGQKVDERSDIYSLGIVMYEMITGKVPFDGENAVEVAVKHMNEPMPKPSHITPEMPQDLEDIILKATSKSPDDRYKNAEEMITDLNFIKFSRQSDYALGYDDEDGISDDTQQLDLNIPEDAAGAAKSPAGKKAVHKKSKLFTLIAVVLALALAIPVSGILAKVFYKGPDTEGIVEVPPLEDLSFDEAKAKLEGMGLGIILDQEIINEDKAPGTILSYTPSQGTSVKVGYSVKVKVSKKAGEKTVPVLDMLELSRAKTMITQNEYKLGTITESYDESVPKGYVISSNPGKGTVLEKGGTINLRVSKGKDPSGATSFELKNMKGMTQEEAIAYIEGNQCTANVILGANSSVPSGCVYLQSPQAGTEIEFGSEITINVNNKQSTDPTPDDLHEVGLNLDFSLADSDDFNITITVQYLDKVEQQVLNVAASKSMDSCVFEVLGIGNGKAIVTYGNRKVYEFSINFDNGTYVPTYIYTPEVIVDTPTEE